MSVNIYIPMTRMNFVAAIDANVIAPSGFFKRRKFYEDKTGVFEQVILGSNELVHFDTEQWNAIQNLDSSSVDEDINEISLNFPIILKVKVNQKKLKKLSKRKLGYKSTSWNKQDSVSSQIVVVDCLLPISAIDSITVPSNEALNALHEDPFFKDIAGEFSIHVHEGKLDQSELLEEVFDHQDQVNFTSQIDLDKVDEYYSLVGGLMMLLETAQVQTWQGAHGYSSQILDLVVQFINKASYQKNGAGGKNSLDCNLIDCFADNRNEENRIHPLIDFILRDRMDEEDSIESESLMERDEIFFSDLLRSCIETNPKEVSPRCVIEYAFDQYSSRKSACLEESRIKDGFQFLLDVLDGKQAVNKMIQPYNRDWARSLRCMMMFGLRHKPNNILSWDYEKKPIHADVLDLYYTAFLSGLYNGATRLPGPIKQRWKGLIDASLERISENKKQLPFKNEVVWTVENYSLHAECCIQVGKTTKIRYTKNILFTELIDKFVQKAHEDISNNKAVEAKRVIALLANQCGMHDLSFKRITIPEINEDSQDGQFKISGVNLDLIRSEWDYVAILDRLAHEVKQFDLPNEIVHLICSYLGQSTCIIEDKPMDKSQLFKNQLDKYLVEIDKKINTEQGSIVGIHQKGIKIIRELLSIFADNKFLIPGNVKIIKSLIFYFILENDVISEVYDDDLGLIDDWLLTTKSIANLKLEADQDLAQQMNLLKIEAVALEEDLESLFGAVFVETIFKKINQSLHVWGSLK